MHARVVILIGSLEQGGAQSMALRLLDGFENLRIEVHLVTLDGNREVPVHGDPRRAAELSGRIIALGKADAARNTFRKVLSAPWQWVRLHFVLRRLKSGVLISFMERANILSLMSLGRRRRIISIRKHLSMALAAKPLPKRVLIRLLYPLFLRRAQGINLNSREAARNFQALFSVPEDKISVIHNNCDRDLLLSMAEKPLPAEFAPVFDKPVILACGRLVKAKGFQHLLPAFRAVHSRHPDLRLVILGDGPLKKELLQLSRDLDIDRFVHWPGYQDNPFAWMGRSSIFVLSSLAEGFPNALLEAMTLGLPVISTACPSGPREILDEYSRDYGEITEMTPTKYGILVPCFDRKSKGVLESARAGQEAMSRAILTLHENGDLRNRYSRAAKERAAAFSVDRFYKQWLELVE